MNGSVEGDQNSKGPRVILIVPENLSAYSASPRAPLPVMALPRGLDYGSRGDAEYAEKDLAGACRCLQFEAGRFGYEWLGRR